MSTLHYYEIQVHLHLLTTNIGPAILIRPQLYDDSENHSTIQIPTLNFMNNKKAAKIT